jgi:plasmid stabilization system protein ParE
MSFNIVFKEEASLDVFDAMKWYESRQVALGNRFLDEIEKHLRILEQEPQLFQIRKNNWRYCPLRRFPYLIVYEIEKEDVIVYAVFNTHQNPLRLRSRKEEK